jgi:hypothetical protein
MSSFSVFDSKGGEIVGPKASPAHNKTISTILKFDRDTSGNIQSVSSYRWFWLREDQRGEPYLGMVREREESGGRLKPIIPLGDICKGKISFQRSKQVLYF